MSIGETGSVYKTSRFNYLFNYFLAGIVFLIMILLFPHLNIMRNILHFGIFFGLLIIATALLEEPEREKYLRKYVITNNEIVKLEGVLKKTRISIPFNVIANVKVSKGIAGRIFNVGHVNITGFKDEILIKGVKNPEELQRIIQNKINMQRESIIKKFRGKQ